MSNQYYATAAISFLLGVSVLSQTHLPQHIFEGRSFLDFLNSFPQKSTFKNYLYQSHTLYVPFFVCLALGYSQTFAYKECPTLWTFNAETETSHICALGCLTTLRRCCCQESLGIVFKLSLDTSFLIVSQKHTFHFKFATDFPVCVV